MFTNSPAFPFPPNKMSNWITQFQLIVMPDTLFLISLFWSKSECESFDCEGRKLGFERFEYTCSRWELKKKTVPSFLKNLNLRGKIVLIMNQLKSANCSKFHLHQILNILTGNYLSTILLLYLAYRVLGSWNSCKH